MCDPTAESVAESHQQHACDRYTGTGVLALCLAAFLAASVSDPGFVSKANVAHWLRTPYDDVTNKRKLCITCGLQRPARAKHCNVCGR